jgi:hypothetical protein
VSPLALESPEGTWRLDELCSFGQLFEEGRRMHHCVATYAPACLRGDTAIWSLRLEQAGRELARVTLRINRRTRSIVEARRFANRFIEDDELRVLADWARRNRLRVAPAIAPRTGLG